MKALRQLIEHEVRKTLNEASYTEADVPKFFWLVTDISPRFPENAQQLASGELKGVKGISASKRILVDFLGVARNAVVIMPAKPFLKLNRVSRVMYDNPHYLVSKNLAAIFRLLDRSQENERDWAVVIERIMDYMKAVQNSMKLSKELATIMYYVERGNLSPTWFGKIFSKEKPKIDTVRELAAWFKKASIQIASERSKDLVDIAKGVSVNEWQELLLATLKHLGSIYKGEAEWLVKDDSLKIPPGSTVLVALGLMPEEISDKAKEILQNPEAKPKIMMPRLKDEVEQLKFINYVESLGLDKRYNFKFISKRKFDEYRKRLWNK